MCPRSPRALLTRSESRLSASKDKCWSYPKVTQHCLPLYTTRLLNFKQASEVIRLPLFPVFLPSSSLLLCLALLHHDLFCPGLSCLYTISNAYM